MKHRLLWINSFIVVVLFFPTVGLSQSAKLKIGSSFYSGNVNKFNMHSELNLANKDSVYELSFNAKAIYSETEHVQDNEQYNISLKADYKPFNRLSPFVVTSYYRNRFKGYEHRLSGITGAKYTVFENPKSDYSISAAYQFDKEQYTSSEAKENFYRHRLSVRPKMKQKIGSSISFQHITFYRPLVNEWYNYLIESTTSITTEITEKLDLSISYELNFDSKPPSEDIKTTDQVTLVSLTLKL